jgi:Domain of unknown function (DUF4268)
MYDKRVREEFWTRFGQYMALQASASGERINWINYKTGVRQVQLKIEVDDQKARIAVLITSADNLKRGQLINQFLQDKLSLDSCSENPWEHKVSNSSHDQTITALFQELNGVNINVRTDWPAIISFLKPLMICFDLFWNQQKDLYEYIAG